MVAEARTRARGSGREPSASSLNPTEGRVHKLLRAVGSIAISVTIGAIVTETRWNETGEAASAAQQGGPVLGAQPVEGPPQLDKLKLPRGFSVAIYADHIDDARSMALAPDGTIFVGTRRRGTVY